MLLLTLSVVSTVPYNYHRSEPEHLTVSHTFHPYGCVLTKLLLEQSPVAHPKAYHDLSEYCSAN